MAVLGVEVVYERLAEGLLRGVPGDLGDPGVDEPEEAVLDDDDALVGVVDDVPVVLLGLLEVGLGPVLVDGGSDALGEDLVVAGVGLLSDVVVDADGEGLLGEFLAALACVEDDGCVCVLSDLCGELYAVEVGHLVVCDDAVDVFVGDRVEGLQGVVGGLDVECGVCAFEDELGYLELVWVVVYMEYADCGFWGHVRPLGGGLLNYLWNKYQ